MSTDAADFGYRYSVVLVFGDDDRFTVPMWYTIAEAEEYGELAAERDSADHFYVIDNHGVAV